MNDCDQELFEAELRKLTPAPPSAELMRKLATAKRGNAGPRPSISNTHPSCWGLLRWLAPGAAVGAAAVAWLVWRPSAPEPVRHAQPVAAPARPALRADEVEFDQRLVASFDAVARLPSGQPVRFRCREWADAFVLRDSASGIVIEERAPRLEIVPVSFETY